MVFFNIKNNSRKTKFNFILPLFIGTVFEWYDFSIFAFFSPIISSKFFPSSDPIASYISIYLVFAIGFFARPIGAMVLGYFGDKLGRKKVLTLSMSIISITTLMMGLIPTYEKLGILSPTLLVFLRLIQGFCVGGETTGSASFILESLPEKNRGTLGSFMWSAVGVGILASSFFSTITIKLLSHDQLYSFGWRIPFLFGFVTWIVGYYFRKKIPESILFDSIKENNLTTNLTIFNILNQNKISILNIIGLYALSSVITYLIFIFMPFYGSNIVHINLITASMVTNFSIAFVTLFVPLAGFLSDYVGRKICLYIGAFGFLISSYPLYTWMSTAKSMTSFIFSNIIFVIFASLYQGVLTATTQEMVNTPIRYTVTAFAYNISYAFFGGTAPFIVMYSTKVFNDNSIQGMYLSIISFVSLICILNIKETYKAKFL